MSDPKQLKSYSQSQRVNELYQEWRGIAYAKLFNEMKGILGEIATLYKSLYEEQCGDVLEIQSVKYNHEEKKGIITVFTGAVLEDRILYIKNLLDENTKIRSTYRIISSNTYEVIIDM